MIGYYRLNPRNSTTKIPNVSKEACFQSFLEAFEMDELKIFVDADQVPEWLSRNSIECLGGIGNSRSFLHILKKASLLLDEEVIYFAEDDYLYCRRDCSCLLKEGFETGAHYVTLYDHPDKYVGLSQKDSPLASEKCQVFVTDSCHWRTTNSTTMTFAAKVGTLREDYDVIRKHLQSNKPKDFRMFLELRNKGRLLVSSVPGFATHCVPGFLSPLTDWDNFFNAE